MIHSDVVHRRWSCPRRRGGSDIRNLLSDLAERTYVRDRERQHVRGEAHPLFRVMAQEEASNEAANNAAVPLVFIIFSLQNNQIFCHSYSKFDSCQKKIDNLQLLKSL